MDPRAGSPDDGAALDELLETLSNPVRRAVVGYFENRPGETTASLSELTDHVERRGPPDATGRRATLYQVHLPTLDSRGWLEFDTEGETVTYHGHPEAERLLRDLLETFENDDRSRE